VPHEIFRGRILSAEDLAGIGRELESFDAIEAIDDEMRAFIVRNWPDLAVKLPPAQWTERSGRPSPPRSDEETDNPLRADDRNFYKVEKWTKDGAKIERLLYAGNNLDKARELFAEAVKHRPRMRLTIRQRTRVLEQWPKEH
jgi:hypothetical protein